MYGKEFKNLIIDADAGAYDVIVIESWFVLPGAEAIILPSCLLNLIFEFGGEKKALKGGLSLGKGYVPGGAPAQSESDIVSILV